MGSEGKKGDREGEGREKGRGKEERRGGEGREKGRGKGGRRANSIHFVGAYLVLQEPLNLVVHKQWLHNGSGCMMLTLYGWQQSVSTGQF